MCACVCVHACNCECVCVQERETVGEGRMDLAEVNATRLA